MVAEKQHLLKQANTNMTNFSCLGFKIIERRSKQLLGY